MVRVEHVDQEWALVGDGEDACLAAEFVRSLVAEGRSTYTQRSYAAGLAAFLRWLSSEGMALTDVTRAIVVRYVRSLIDDAPHPLAPASINHRLSVLSSFFAWLLAQDETDTGAKQIRQNPVPARTERAIHLAAGRDAPRRERLELRRRVPLRIPRSIEPDAAAQLIASAPSARDGAILTLLWRTGARIGDWISETDRHGVLGLDLADIDGKHRMVRVRLKGARNEHAIPVTDDFWMLWEQYLREERDAALGSWAWVGRRRARGQPLRYDAFAAMLREVAARAGVTVHAHMFRHALAQAVMATSGLQVAQEILGHQHLSTTTAFYARVDEAAMVDGVERAARRAGPEPTSARAVWAFAYDAITLDELVGQFSRL